MANKTFTEVQKEVMDVARRNELDESQAESLLRRRLRQEGIPLPDYMAKKQEFKKGGMPKKKMAGGGYATKKMAGGGYANCGASVPGTQRSK